MRKHFVLSTRTLVSKREVTQSFGTDNTVYVPMAVMEEIEKKYWDQVNERGKIARETLTYLGSFHYDQLKKGVIQKNSSILIVPNNFYDIEINEKVLKSDLSKLDIRILQTCLGIQKQVPENEPVILVSKKASLRKKAEMLGIKAQTFRDELLPELNEQYSGRKLLKVSDEKVKKFRENGKIAITEVVAEEELSEMYENMFIEFKGFNWDWALGRVKGGEIVKLQYENYHPYGVIPKNNGQKFMIEALMADFKEAPLVIFKGPAGTAKTFMSLAVGLELVQEKDKYPNKILISRSPTETGEKIGFLPGTEIDKISPYLRGIMDNITALNTKKDETTSEVSNFKKRKNNFGGSEKPEFDDGTFFFERNDIKAEAVGYIRGRSICDTYIIIDEAQNLSPVEIETIITRVGTGTKLILLGDPAQIDRPELDERNNGLSYASERMKGEKTCWQITMTDDESVRSELAKRASMLL
ncbi:MAG: PhoH family protein [Clostridia bacterium]